MVISLWYLMRVKRKFASHYDAWINLGDRIKKTKNSKDNRVGDLYELKCIVSDPNYDIIKYNPDNYHPPQKDHPHNAIDKDYDIPYWNYDIQRFYNNSRPYVLLFGVPDFQFCVWTIILILGNVLN